MPIHSHVDANYRYIAAHQEINARIGQRQQALTLYATLVVSLLAALVALKPVSEEAPVEWLVFGFSLASICFAFLNLKTERAITNLRRFLSALERLADAHRSLPSYNTDPQWSEEANRARRCTTSRPRCWWPAAMASVSRRPPASTRRALRCTRSPWVQRV